jgi:broad specificity phosphatase PhoE
MMSVKPKGGESLCEVKNRVAEFIKMLHERHKKESVLIITHGGIILTIVSILLKTPLERLYGELHFNNACICKLTISETGKTKMRHLC